MLQFRAMQDSDLDTMAQIVERVWIMDALCGGKKADGSCLGNIFGRRWAIPQGRKWPYGMEK